MDETQNTLTAAVIGLGIIGAEWARHLDADGLLAAAWNRTPRPEMAKFDHELRGLPTKANLLHIVVSDEKALTDVMNELLQGLTTRHTVVQSTTIDPRTSGIIRRKVEARGAKYLEAPFTGSLPAAKERQTVFYLGGESGLIEQTLPYLRHLSQRWYHIGTNEQACTLKLAMNLQIASAMAALAESITLCRRSGISDEVFFDAFRHNAAYSGIAALKEPKLKARDFSPQFSVKHMRKDMRLLSESIGAGLPVLGTVLTLLQRAEEQNLSDEDFSAIIKLLD